MKKFIFTLHHTKEVIKCEIYAVTYWEAKRNITVATGCKEDQILFVEELLSLAPETWIF